MSFEDFGSEPVERRVHGQWKNYSINILDLDKILFEARQSNYDVPVLATDQLSEFTDYTLIECNMMADEAKEAEELIVHSDIKVSNSYYSTVGDIDPSFSLFIHDKNYELGEIEISPVNNNLYFARDKKCGSNFIISFNENGIYLTNLFLDENAPNSLMIEPMPTYLVKPELTLVSISRATAVMLDFLEQSSSEKNNKTRPILNEVKQINIAVVDQNVSSSHPVPELELNHGQRKILLSDIYGLDEIKSQLTDIVLSFAHPDIIKLWDTDRPRGIFFHGPGGTGKSITARALANEIGADFKLVQSSEIQNEWMGGSEKKIKKIFDDARAHEGKLVLFFDQFETLIHNISGNRDSGSAANNSVAGIFKQEMDSLLDFNPNVLVVAASKNPGIIDEDLIRSGRFDTKLYFSLPDSNARKDIFLSHVLNDIVGKELDLELSLENLDSKKRTDSYFKKYEEDIDFTELSSKSNDLSRSDIIAILRKVRFNKAIQQIKNGEFPKPISTDDILNEINNFKKQKIN